MGLTIVFENLRWHLSESPAPCLAGETCEFESLLTMHAELQTQTESHHFYFHTYFFLYNANHNVGSVTD